MSDGSNNGKKSGSNGKATSEGNGSNGHTYSDSAAQRRAAELTKKLGIDLWAKYPKELLEFRMDLPPKEPDPKDVVAWQKWEEKRRKWKPIHSPKVRVYATYMRYSWCWPICLEYAVVTDDRDEILRDHKGRPLVLSEEAVAEMHGLSQQRISNVNLDLIADKLIRREAVPGTARSQAVFIEPKPVLTDEERRHKSTVVTTGISGPRLEPAVLRRFSSLLKQLGEDDDLISLPKAELERLNGDAPEGTIRAGDYRTLVWTEILDNRTVFLRTLKTARYSERKGYGDTATRVRNLIDQRESSEIGQVAAAASSAAPASPPPPQPPPVKSGGFGYARRATPQPGIREQESPGETKNAAAIEDAFDQVYRALGPFCLVDDSRVLEMIAACRAVRPDAKASEMAHFISAKGTELRKRGTTRDMFRLLLTSVPPLLKGQSFLSHRMSQQAAVDEDLARRRRDIENSPELRAQYQEWIDDPNTPEEERQFYCRVIKGTG